MNPEYATAHHWYAWYLVTVGRAPEALAEIRRARELEPFSPIITAQVGAFCYYARQYEEGVRELRKAVETDPTFFASHLHLGQIYAVQRKPKEATAELEAALHFSQRRGSDLAQVGCSFGSLGQREQAQKLLDELIGRSRQEYVAPHLLALIYAGLGERSRAIEWFERGLQERSLLPLWLRNPQLDGIRSDPKFQTILQRMGLPP
jgi:Tfp pilus assembly protein PilF